MHRIDPDKTVEENINNVIEYYHIEDHDGKMLLSNFEPYGPIVQINLTKGMLITKADIPTGDVKLIDLLVQFYISEIRYNQISTYEYLYGLMSHDLKATLNELYAMIDYEKRTKMKGIVGESINILNKISDYVGITNDTLGIHNVRFSMDEIMSEYGIDVYPTPFVIGGYTRVKEVINELYMWLKPKSIEFKGSVDIEDHYTCSIYFNIGEEIVLTEDNITYKICEYIIHKIGGFIGTYNYNGVFMLWVEFNFVLAGGATLDNTIDGLTVSTTITNQVVKKRVHDAVIKIGGEIVTKNARIFITDAEVGGDIMILPPTHVIYNHERVIHSPVCAKVLYDKIKYIMTTPEIKSPPQKILVISNKPTVLKDLLIHMGYEPVQISESSPMDTAYDTVFIISNAAHEIVKKIRKNYLYSVYIVLIKDPNIGSRTPVDTVVTTPFDRKTIAHVLDMARSRLTARGRRASCSV